MENQKESLEGNQSQRWGCELHGWEMVDGELQATLASLLDMAFSFRELSPQEARRRMGHFFPDEQELRIESAIATWQEISGPENKEKREALAGAIDYALPCPGRTRLSSLEL